MGVHCLAAMDSTKSDVAKDKAVACAKAEGADFTVIDACFQSDEASTLEAAEAKYFDTKFPGAVGVPHIEINGEAQNSRTYASLISALCATGIKAGACSQSVQV